MTAESFFIKTPLEQLVSHDLIVQSQNQNNQVDITFKKLTYSVMIDQPKSETAEANSFNPLCKSQKTEKVILKNISGIFKAKELSAIMGVSGSGKTTLLNAIGKRLDQKLLQGQILANGKAYSSEQFGNFGNYLMQKNILFQTLTVKESLHFAADLKLDLSEAQKEQKINFLLKKLMLERCLNTLVGGQFVTGISGGQKKRVSLAMELISDPQVLLLDQPTSGLDSLTSYVLINFLKELAVQQAKTIILTIHQPGPEIYQKFDKLMLIANGELLYQGEASFTLEYFNKQFNKACGLYENPAQLFITIMHQISQPEEEKTFNQYSLTYSKTIEPRIDKEITQSRTSLIKDRSIEVSFIFCLMTLLSRQFKNTKRNPQLLKARLVQTLFNVIFVGGIFFGIGRQSYEDPIYWAAISGFLFLTAYGTFQLALFQACHIFPVDREVFLKEENSKLYSLSAYFLSKNLVDIPFLFLAPLLCNPIIYFMVGLSVSAQQYFIFNLLTFVTLLCGDSLGMFIGTFSMDTFDTNSNLIPLIMNPIIMFGGYYVNRESIAPWIRWVEYLTPVKYNFNAYIFNQVLHKQSKVGQLNLNFGIWDSIGVIFAFCIFYKICAFVTLWFKKGRLQ